MKLPLQLHGSCKFEEDGGFREVEEGNGGGTGGGEKGGFSDMALVIVVSIPDPRGLVKGDSSVGFSVRPSKVSAMSDGCICLASGAGGREVNESSQRAAIGEKRLLGGGTLSLTHDVPIRGAARRLNRACLDMEAFAMADSRSGLTR